MRYDEGGNRLRLARLSDRGVKVWGAEQVWIAEDVRLERIEPGAEIYQAALSGSELFIGAGTRVGISGPARISDCQIGRGCEIGAGTFDGATLLDGACIRGFAEVRPGTLLEEQTEAAHSVAFKNTILTATCVAGSLINYCDLFMTGGTSRSNHSEIGSGAIHFNFDPRGDKWGTLIGDPRGLLLRRAPIFVGGQVGIVGPVEIDFGAVVAAGSIVRKNVPADCIYADSGPSAIQAGFDRQRYGRISRKLLTTAKLAGTYLALWNWYQQIRIPQASEHEIPLYEGAIRQIEHNLRERASRIGKLIKKLPASIDQLQSEGTGELVAEHRRIVAIEASLVQALNPSTRWAESERPPALDQAYSSAREGHGHVEAVTALPTDVAQEAEAWLLSICRATEDKVQALIAREH